MSSDRAGPLLLNAACPLPADSFAHWSQYQRIEHSLTAPDVIEIRAECQTQQEHRFLYDWCSWLVQELNGARALLANSKSRHSWVPPMATIGDVDSTIIIRPARGATYLALDWKLELDHDAVFKRLIYDVYQSDFAYIRELIQNSLDATRCKVYEDIKQQREMIPLSSFDIPKAWTEQYRVEIVLEDRQIDNEMSGETETKQVLIVNDYGIGMDRDIVQRYFLQIGRSYYITEEFRRNYSFVPTGRFGIGFLSVFAVSENVTVETKKGLSGEAIKAVLTGPRSYLLTDIGTRNVSGTKVELVLNNRLEKGRLTKVVSGLCRRVEFPIIVREFGMETKIEAEDPSVFDSETSDLDEEGAKFRIKSFPLVTPNIKGEMYVFSNEKSNGDEEWDRIRYAKNGYMEKHPMSEIPVLPSDLTCLHGISVSDDTRASYKINPFSFRIDYRGAGQTPTLARDSFRDKFQQDNWENDSQILSQVEGYVSHHLSNSAKSLGPNGWKYRQRLADYIDLPMWQSRDDMVSVLVNGQERLVGIEEITSADSFVIISRIQVSYLPRNLAVESEYCKLLSEFYQDTLCISTSTLSLLCDSHRISVFKNHMLSGMGKEMEEHVGFVWTQGDGFFKKVSSNTFYLLEYEDDTLVGFKAHQTQASYSSCLVLNTKNDFVQWLIRLVEASKHGQFGLTEQILSHLFSLLTTTVEHSGYRIEKLQEHVDAWRTEGLPPELCPPSLKLEQRMFLLIEKDVLQYIE